MVSIAWNGAPKTKATFNIDDIDTQAQINKWISLFGTGGDYGKIVSNFCSGSESTDCIIDPETKKPMEGCSRLRAANSSGNFCRTWFESQPAGVKDSTIQNYCLNHNTPDCRCLNKNQDPIWAGLKTGKVINDGCWFLPCTNSSTYLVPSNEIDPSCPDNFCDVIYNMIENNNININDVQNEVKCDFSGKGGGPTPPPPGPTPPGPTPPGPTPPGPTPPGPTPPGPAPPTISKFKEFLNEANEYMKKHYIITSVATTVVLFFILTFIILLMNRKKNNSKSYQS